MHALSFRRLKRQLCNVSDSHARGKQTIILLSDVTQLLNRLKFLYGKLIELFLKGNRNEDDKIAGLFCACMWIVKLTFNESSFLLLTQGVYSAVGFYFDMGHS